MENEDDHPLSESESDERTSSDAFPTHLTVSQAYDYLIVAGLPRSKKTIRKWCRQGDVDNEASVLAGGSKWLITKQSLDARIAEERRIDASLSRETGSNHSAPVLGQTRSNGSEPVQTREIIDVLKEQLDHERAARKSAEDQNRNLIDMYHEISTISAQVGIEFSKGMQEQAKARRLNGNENEFGASPISGDMAPMTYRNDENPNWQVEESKGQQSDDGVDNPNKISEDPVIESNQ